MACCQGTAEAIEYGDITLICDYKNRGDSEAKERPTQAFSDAVIDLRLNIEY